MSKTLGATEKAAAQRRKNAAHGASRGVEVGSKQAPKGRKSSSHAHTKALGRPASERHSGGYALTRAHQDSDTTFPKAIRPSNFPALQ